MSTGISDEKQKLEIRCFLRNFLNKPARSRRHRAWQKLTSCAVLHARCCFACYADSFVMRRDPSFYLLCTYLERIANAVVEVGCISI